MITTSLIESLYTAASISQGMQLMSKQQQVLTNYFQKDLHLLMLFVHTFSNVLSTKQSMQGAYLVINLKCSEFNSCFPDCLFISYSSFKSEVRFANLVHEGYNKQKPRCKQKQALMSQYFKIVQHQFSKYKVMQDNCNCYTCISSTPIQPIVENAQVISQYNVLIDIFYT
ncbi:unnamed protein product [Paramecium octaurelia]|uniref:Uncharacterized protein n=1 Tax=Paramecium octaurelia TaxID=43137 RepID=A0A8S1YQF7_PAROT|nr:unnamed protein product [Paramecium octaurelia]